MRHERAVFLNDNMPRLQQADRIGLNNPVIMQGAGMAPLIVAATTGNHALMLAVAVLLLVTPTRIFGALLQHFFGHRYSILFYAGVACLLYIPIFLAMYEWFGRSLLELGIYLPLLVIDPLVIRRYSLQRAENPIRALRIGFTTTMGYLVVLLLFGFGRELLAKGTLLGYTILPVALFPMASQPAGGFILLGILCAVWRGGIAVFRKRVNMEAGRTYE